MGYEEDGHTILDLEEIPIHEIRQEEPNVQFQYLRPAHKVEALLE